MTANPLLDTYTFLADVVRDDPFLLLANAVAWLDPLWTLDADNMELEEDGLGIALVVTRRAFPDIYAGAVERIRAGESETALDRFICSEITRRGIPLDTLESMSYGIPLEAAGVTLEDPEFYGQHPDAVPILALFGIDPEREMYTVEVPDAAYKAGRAAADSLLKQPDERWRQVGWALAWLFSCSGNSLVDLDYESMAEIPPLSWDADDVAFAIELIEEADGILRDVQVGIDYLKQSPNLRAALERNVAHLYRELKQKGKLGERHLRLEWKGDAATVALCDNIPR